LFEGSAEALDAGATFDPQATRQSLPAMTVTGPHSSPRSVLYGPQADGVMVLFYPDAWWALTGVSPQDLTNQIVDAHSVLPAALLAACERMRKGGHANTRVKTFFEDLLPLWDERDVDRFTPTGPQRNWAQAFAPWMESLALRAAATGWGRSLRQSERRIKQWTGWSLRKLQGSVRGEAAFFAVMEAMLEDRVDWAQIALDNGFSDQSHFIRETRRITGFSPETLRHGLIHEEAFWVYRAWAQLAGFQTAPDVVASSHAGLRP
jgi:AraC-like DNA-binding protein